MKVTFVSAFFYVFFCFANLQEQCSSQVVQQSGRETELCSGEEVPGQILTSRCQHLDTDAHCIDINLFNKKTYWNASHLNKRPRQPLNVSQLQLCIFYEGTTQTVQNLLIFIFLLMILTYIYIFFIEIQMIKIQKNAHQLTFGFMCE